MIILSIYLTIAFITFWALSGFFMKEKADDNVVNILAVSAVACFIWPAIIFAVIFEMMERK